MNDAMRALKYAKFELKEKCGVVAVSTTQEVLPQITRRALAALQHRGQESAGMTIFKRKGGLKTYVGMGLVPHVFSDKNLLKLGKGKATIAQNRYSTTGHSTLLNAQPFTLKRGKYQISIGHNGNIPDLTWLNQHIAEKPTATSDTALVATFLLEQRQNYSSWEETLRKSLPNIHGAYCFVILTEDGTVFGVRDPYGIRPFCLGKIKNGWILASESVALDVVGAQYVRDIVRGEIIKISLGGNIHSSFFGKPKRQKFDIFELIYFSRPDSYIRDQRVRIAREESGKKLAKRLQQKKIRAEVVVPIFDSGYPAAKGVAKALGIPLVEAITASHYVGRTFILPGQERRIAAVNGKHNFTPDGIVGKKVIFVDDSAVRLTTSVTIVDGLREAGASEVHAAFASPPIVRHCDMGIDLKSKSELPASAWKDKPLPVIEKNVAHHVGAESATYLPIEETAAAMNGTIDDFYYHPFGGPHPIRDDNETFKKRKKQIAEKPKITVFISGAGTNLQKILDDIKKGRIDAKIIEVISNNPLAAGLTKAKKNEIPTSVFSSKGIIKDIKKRQEYEKIIVKHVLQNPPDIIVFAGWMVIMGDIFLSAMQEREIPVINLHPALITQRHEDAIMTSRGEIPVLRGMLPQVIEEVFAKNLPLSGVTIHQLVPGNDYDTGPIILKEEVRRVEGESKEEFEARIHQAEYRVLPAAINRVLHVLGYGINVAKGTFPW